ncbi:MAG TPA: type II toxin-antitoxin system HicB family antitoxin [Lacipirellulaceae bacterium]|jgi:predicted RNase H-like HicB family nuclease|nr:type II toxin-antitoxin system HicB family antitoxin [Lacipirellulaceae bacterium]
MTQLKFVIEQHADGFLAYPLGLSGIVVGEGDTYDDALADAKSAAKFHIETFGEDAQAEHIALRRNNAAGTVTPMTIRNHRAAKGSTLSPSSLRSESAVRLLWTSTTKTNSAQVAGRTVLCERIIFFSPTVAN